MTSETKVSDTTFLFKVNIVVMVMLGLAMMGLLLFLFWGHWDSASGANQNKSDEVKAIEKRLDSIERSPKLDVANIYCVAYLNRSNVWPNTLTVGTEQFPPLPTDDDYLFRVQTASDWLPKNRELVEIRQVVANFQEVGQLKNFALCYPILGQINKDTVYLRMAPITPTTAAYAGIQITVIYTYRDVPAK